MRPLIYRTTADTFVDLVINHPTVRPTIDLNNVAERLTSLEVLSDYRNVCLATTGGVALFMWQAPGHFEGHIMLIDAARGYDGLAFGKGALGVMFASYGALKITAVVPRVLRGAIMHVRRLGFVSIERGSDMEHFVMEKELWAE